MVPLPPDRPIPPVPFTCDQPASLFFLTNSSSWSSPLPTRALPGWQRLTFMQPNSICKNICVACSCGSSSLHCSAGGLQVQWEHWLHTGTSWSSWLGWQRCPSSVSAAAITQLVVQVLPQSLAMAQELMTEQVADVRIAEAWLEMRGAHSEQLVETSLC